MKAQRLRIRYRVAGAAVGLSNRELVSAWETAVRNAGFAVAYSEGRRPSPQIALAAPLPLGVTSDCEIVDIYLEQPADPDAVLSKLRAGLPDGLEPLTVADIGVDGPSLQSQLRRAEYRVVLHPTCPTADELNRRAGAMLAADSLPSEYVRTNKVKAYDLRPLILSIEATDEGECTGLHMRLRAEPENTARADQVLLALGVDCEAQVHRTRLELDDVPPVLQAYRRAGEPTGEELQ